MRIIYSDTKFDAQKIRRANYKRAKGLGYNNILNLRKGPVLRKFRKFKM